MKRRLNYRQRCKLRAEIIEVCATTRAMPELIEILTQKGWYPTEIIQVVYAAETTGLLFSRGKGRGRVYRTTREARGLL